MHEMNTMFTKHMKTLAPVNGWMAICQRPSRCFGVVELNF